MKDCVDISSFMTRLTGSLEITMLSAVTLPLYSQIASSLLGHRVPVKSYISRDQNVVIIFYASIKWQSHSKFTKSDDLCGINITMILIKEKLKLETFIYYNIYREHVRKKGRKRTKQVAVLNTIYSKSYLKKLIN